MAGRERDVLGVVAAGSGQAATVGAGVLAAGGNAFDAAVAAGFAASVAEPALTSLGGGGFCMARTAAGEEVLVDFFVDMPGLGLDGRPADPHFEPVTVRFPGVEQVFVMGLGSVAVPGVLAGLVHVHRRFGRLPLADVVEPAARMAADGVPLEDVQAYAASLLTPIMTATSASRALFAPHGRLLAAGELLVNPDLAALLRSLPDGGGDTLHRGPVAEQVAADMAAGGGLLTADDLAAYRVVEREPLVTRFRGHRVLTNPPPGTGGRLVAVSLTAADAAVPEGCRWGDPAHAVGLVEAMVAADAARAGPSVTRGTTHISVADADGNVASMTTSNGEGSGYVAPGTGVMLNNMLGEDDLHPDGFHTGPPGVRVGSMMAPSVVLGPAGEPVLAVGSGGSKRIRNAILQVVVSCVALGVDVERAVAAPRLHWDGTAVQAEPGWPDAALAAVAERWPVRRWDTANMYFGGVQAVVPGRAGVGDARRGGGAVTVEG